MFTERSRRPRPLRPRPLRPRFARPPLPKGRGKMPSPSSLRSATSPKGRGKMPLALPPWLSLLGSPSGRAVTAGN